MKIPIYQIDAFTDKVFGGNPAAVCPLEEWPADDTLRKIAAENNLSETAFFVKQGDKFQLRWFTPLAEIDLCGHATLASGFVLFDILGYSGDTIHFTSQSGPLLVSRKNGHLVLDFPTRIPIPCDVPENLVKALGQKPLEILKSRDYMCVFHSESDLRDLRPNMELLKTLDADVLVTAPGENSDFVSRYFAPLFGIPEDPVTGSTHCNLIPYWAEKLGKKKLHAKQISERGGELFCEMLGDRVAIGGSAVEFLRGTITV